MIHARQHRYNQMAREHQERARDQHGLSAELIDPDDGGDGGEEHDDADDAGG